MLPAEVFHFHRSFTQLRTAERQLPSRLKIAIILKRQGDPNGSVQTLRPDDSSNG